MPRLTTNFINTKVDKPEKGKTLFYRDSELTDATFRLWVVASLSGPTRERRRDSYTSPQESTLL